MNRSIGRARRDEKFGPTPNPPSQSQKDSLDPMLILKNPQKALNVEVQNPEQLIRYKKNHLFDAKSLIESKRQADKIKISEQYQIKVEGVKSEGSKPQNSQVHLKQEAIIRKTKESDIAKDFTHTDYDIEENHLKASQTQKIKYTNTLLHPNIPSLQQITPPFHISKEKPMSKKQTDPLPNFNSFKLNSTESEAQLQQAFSFSRAEQARLTFELKRDQKRNMPVGELILRESMMKKEETQKKLGREVEQQEDIKTVKKYQN